MAKSSPGQEAIRATPSKCVEALDLMNQYTVITTRFLTNLSVGSLLKFLIFVNLSGASFVPGCVLLGARSRSSV
jgi:hypothetical protein